MNIDGKKRRPQLLLQAGHVRVISHASPDGDTLGCASALLRGLSQKGKAISFACSDPVPEKFSYLFNGLTFSQGEPDFVCAVDIADKQLFGKVTTGAVGGKNGFVYRPPRDQYRVRRPYAIR